MSEKSFTIRVKIDKCEIELKGSRVDVMQSLNDLHNIVGKVVDAFNSIPIQKVSNSKELKIIEAEYPTLSVPKGISCPEAIFEILSTDWGKEKPRHLRDILKALRLNALHFPIGTVKGRLTDLTKKGRLRRIRSEKGYGYVVAK